LRDASVAGASQPFSSHTAGTSQDLAARLNIRLIWLPTRSPELNPMDHLWRASSHRGLVVNAAEHGPEQSADLETEQKPIGGLTPLRGTFAFTGR
jgi:hypothetical protein